MGQSSQVFLVVHAASSNFTGCCTGRSAGFASRKILSLNSAARAKWSVKLGPYEIRPPAVTNSLKPKIVSIFAALAALRFFPYCHL
jgi:hypothetical protein